SIIAGTGSQTVGSDAWGAYSSMSVDPVDDCTFWYTQEYLKTDGTFNWNTRIAKIKFPSCSLNSPPAAISVTPNSGSGATQTFSFLYSDQDGYTDLSIVYGLFNNVLSGANACFFAYSRVDGRLYLFNNAGNGLVPGSLTPGGPGSLTNSQC